LEKLLEVKNLKTYFYKDEGVYKAVDGISFDLHRGESLGLVGESGCGKSVTALSIIRLIDKPGKIAGGEIFFNGKNILDFSEKGMQKIRGNRISMIFQEPMTSLNPVYRCGFQVEEAIKAHQNVTSKEAKKKTIELLGKAGIDNPEMRYSEYPHQLSGGLRQRVMIAMALACSPDILIADEPTTALDVTIQAQIISLLKDLQKEFGMAILMITHDLGIIANMADNVAVMYASKIVEYGSAEDIFSNHKHPYTKGLFESIPKLTKERERLKSIPGVVPNPIEYPAGCNFYERCGLRIDRCRNDEPELQGATHKCACWAKTINNE
jgi:peptide/nickel transport system ATP-binding protein